MNVRLLTLRDVLALTKLSRQQLWRLRSAGKFPKPATDSYNKVWNDREVRRWIQVRSR
jgi:predicted DNA-binding transcriptional regulator AlpA